jgi:hypothetical protein
MPAVSAYCRRSFVSLRELAFSGLCPAEHMNRIPKFRLLLFAVTSVYPESLANAEALPELIRQLKAGGYKVVHMVPKGELTTVPKYDEMLAHEDKLSSNNTRPESSVIRTIGE